MGQKETGLSDRELKRHGVLERLRAGGLSQGGAGIGIVDAAGTTAAAATGEGGPRGIALGASGQEAVQLDRRAAAGRGGRTDS